MQQLLLLLLLQLRLMLMLPLLPASLLRADRVLAAICAASDVARGVLPRLVDTSRPGPSFVPFAPSNMSSPAVIEALRALKRAALSVDAASTASAVTRARGPMATPPENEVRHPRETRSETP